MTFPYRYSRLAEAMQPSPIRELFGLIRRPGMISFAGGLPDPAIFPVEAFADCAGAIRTQGRTALQYGATEGLPELVDELIGRLEPVLGRTPRRSEVLVTTGSQQGMDLLGRVLLDPGDVVVVEAPTYPGALHTFRNLGARFAPVPCDGDGMIVERLPEVVERCTHLTGAPPRLIYSIVNFSNPSGACLSLRRREELVELASRYGIPVLEDDPYGDLRYDGGRIPSVASLAGGAGTVHAGSFSKILAPGVRLAWVTGDPGLVRRMVLAKQGADLCTSTVDQLIVAEYCRRGELERHLLRIVDHYRAKRDAMAQALHEALPAGSASWQTPAGGFFFWLATAADSRSVFERAVNAGVAFVPGPAFFPDPAECVGDGVDGTPFARLCFTFAQPAEIAEGCRRLAAALGRAAG